jgi:hypothetical protein
MIKTIIDIRTDEQLRADVEADLSHAGLTLNDIEFVVLDDDTGVIEYVSEHYKEEYRPQNQEKRDGIIFNPKQRHYFNQTPDEFRPVLEHLEWSGLYYVMHHSKRKSEAFPNGVCELLVLDGGVHDGASGKGLFESFEAAKERLEQPEQPKPLKRGRLCNVRGCGNGSCVHSWSGIACPHCNHELIRVSSSGYLCCSNPDYSDGGCDYIEKEK